MWFVLFGCELTLHFLLVLAMEHKYVVKVAFTICLNRVVARDSICTTPVNDEFKPLIKFYLNLNLVCILVSTWSHAQYLFRPRLSAHIDSEVSEDLNGINLTQTKVTCIQVNSGLVQSVSVSLAL